MGKIGIPIEILQKNGKLTFGEFEIIKQHPKIGYRILKDSGNELLKMAQEISSFHHEKWNGQGYTEELKGKNIPKSARIVAIVDVFDALMSKRPYKPPFSQEKVKLIFAEDKCKHFDPELLNIFMSNFDVFLDIYKKISDMNKEDVSDILFKNKL
ncbi:MAG: HD domain-containing phosphohydrolase [Thermodesulfobacteriota bacterium]|nr:HD domain-containing phosphohydrolase [Thermodesulfobacteriota bacterium]